MVNEAKPSWTRTTKGNGFSGIGSLEADILAIVWEAEPEALTVRFVYELLRGRRQIAYTTVMTVLGNLVKKGLLSQERSNIAFLYGSAIPGDEVAGDVLDDVVRRLYRERRSVAVSHLIGLERALTEAQLELLYLYARGLPEDE